jgi:hypothetical protein
MYGKENLRKKHFQETSKTLYIFKGFLLHKMPELYIKGHYHRSEVDNFQSFNKFHENR